MARLLSIVVRQLYGVCGAGSLLGTDMLVCRPVLCVSSVCCVVVAITVRDTGASQPAGAAIIKATSHIWPATFVGSPPNSAATHNLPPPAASFPHTPIFLSFPRLFYYFGALHNGIF